ncbi:uncharacterized protein LOC129952957 isoform X2 [Eupeodes corollae]|uniref:uncharacterized protein LOC129952957 isoform X2 n=1 Tax=Eupeodes corollae TaxID=290404 RepID=UPI0024936FA4|nr:uncharacterized protein LOC129952957 isoform X2 [Eupeodes corollae]
MILLLYLRKCSGYKKAYTDRLIPQLAFADIVIKCSNIDEFYYSVPESHCTSYYKCNARGYREIKECGPGSMFDFYTQTCTRSSGVCYEPVCTGRTNGIYQDTTHACRRSYSCFSGRLVSIDNCPPKHLHNGMQCVSQDLVMCDLPQNTAIAFPFSGDNRCVGKENGLHPINKCNEYIKCRNEEVENVNRCPEGYLFKAESNKCTLERFVTGCSEENLLPSNELLCREKRDGSHSDPSSEDCSTYITCKSGKFVSQQQCGQQAVFDGSSCVPSILFQCRFKADLKAYEDVCRSKPNGFYNSPQHGCNYYVRCMGERGVEIHQCPTGQYFDPEDRNCVFEKFADRQKCVQKGISQECSGKTTGFYPDAGCQSYFHCYNGHKTQYKCSSGKIFNGDKCVPKSQFSCNLGADEFCLNRSDGYYKDSTSGCRSFHYCSSGHKITYLCEDGHTFDGQKCVRLSHNNQCRTDFQCYGKSDGYHADVRSNCRNYVFCKNYEKITQLTCRAGNVFNGQKCVSPNEHACPSLYNYRQLNCMPRQCLDQQCATDGFFPDIDSECRSYFFCIGGKASALTCPPGKLFNGEICVTEDTFTCPVYCDTTSNTGIMSCPLGGLK